MILKEIGRPRLDAFIPELLEWLRDKTLPGARIVAEVLAEMENGTLLPHLQRAIAKAALIEGEYEWVFNLQVLKEKVSGRLPEGSNPRYVF